MVNLPLPSELPLAGGLTLLPMLLPPTPSLCTSVHSDLLAFLGEFSVWLASFSSAPHVLLSLTFPLHLFPNFCIMFLSFSWFHLCVYRVKNTGSGFRMLGSSPSCDPRPSTYMSSLVSISFSAKWAPSDITHQWQLWALKLRLPEQIFNKRAPFYCVVIPFPYFSLPLFLSPSQILLHTTTTSSPLSTWQIFSLNIPALEQHHTFKSVSSPAIIKGLLTNIDLEVIVPSPSRLHANDLRVASF